MHYNGMFPCFLLCVYWVLVERIFKSLIRCLLVVLGIMTSSMNPIALKSTTLQRKTSLPLAAACIGVQRVDSYSACNFNNSTQICKLIK